MLDDTLNGSVHYIILNSLGEIVNTGNTQSDQNINIQDLASGTYYIQWTSTQDGVQQIYICKFVRVK